MTRRRRLLADRSGSSAAEMALVTPMLLVLLFGTFELGYFYLSEHVVQKAVRDAARYAARLPVEKYPSCTIPNDTRIEIQKVARTGRPDGTVQRLQGWTADSMTTVQISCNAAMNTGIYKDFPSGAPVIIVSASVNYPTLLGSMGIAIPTLKLNAASQSAGFGA